MGGKFTIFALFYLVFEGKFQVLATRGAYNYSEGRCNGEFSALRFLGSLYLEGLIFGILQYIKQGTVFRLISKHQEVGWKNNEAQLSLMSLTLICLEIGCNTGSAVFIEPLKWTKLLFRKFQCKRLQSFMVISTRHSHMTQKFFSLFCKLNCYLSEFEN